MEILLKQGLHLPLLGDVECMFLHIINKEDWRLETGSDGMLGGCSDVSLIQGRPGRGTHKNPSCTSTTGITRDTCCVHTSVGTPLAWQLDGDINASVICCSPSPSHTWRKKIMSLILIIKHREWSKMPDWVDFWKLGKLDARSPRDVIDEKIQEAGWACIFVKLSFSSGNLKIWNKV